MVINSIKSIGFEEKTSKPIRQCLLKLRQIFTQFKRYKMFKKPAYNIKIIFFHPRDPKNQQWSTQLDDLTLLSRVKTILTNQNLITQ